MKARATSMAAAGLLAAAGVLYVVTHSPEVEGNYPECVFREATGWHCAGCGATRATYALLHLDAAGALSRNALWVILLPVVALVIAVEGLAWLLGERYQGPRVRPPRWCAWAVPAVVVAFWILRNVPAWPFLELAP